MTRLVAALTGLCLLTALLADPPALASLVEVGYEDYSYNGTTAPTGQKPQSKLWVNDGLWWGVLWNPDAKDFHIYRIDNANQTWVDTGTKADTRANSSADALWNGTKLYVASATTSASSSGAGKVWRYSLRRHSQTLHARLGIPEDRHEPRDGGSCGQGQHRDAVGHVYAGRQGVRHAYDDERHYLAHPLRNCRCLGRRTSHPMTCPRS